MVDFLAEVFGNNTEVVLHDVSDTGCSVVAIRNSHISGRKLGAPATNLALKILKDENSKDTNYITNYKGVSSKNEKTLKSSTYFIRDDHKRIIGMLCINIDFEKFSQFRDYLDEIIGVSRDDAAEKEVERFSSSVEELAYESIETVIKKIGISPERMDQNEKIEIIKELNEGGIFLLKGAIGEVASQLKVSEATIYRYLSKVKKE
jgi:predicted transcriptional regulator YheO